MFNETLKVGDEVLFFEGKKNRNIAYFWDGKVILCKNKISKGYARVTSVEDRGNFFLVTAEHIIKDYYEDISYDEFMKLLPMFGFKIGYNLEFENPHTKEDGTHPMENQIFAYNLDLGMIIVAETWRLWGEETFNSINVYCPHMDAFKHPVGFFCGNVNMSQLNLCSIDKPIENILKNICKTQKENVEYASCLWPLGETPFLWHYADDRETCDENGTWNLWERTISRILLVDKEIDSLFVNVDSMKPILAKRTA